MNITDGQKKSVPTSDPVKAEDSEEVIERGISAIKARMEADNRPEEIKKKEEAEDAERWRNEG